MTKNKRKKRSEDFKVYHTTLIIVKYISIKYIKYFIDSIENLIMEKNSIPTI